MDARLTGASFERGPVAKEYMSSLAYVLIRKPGLVAAWRHRKPLFGLKLHVANSIAVAHASELIGNHAPSIEPFEAVVPTSRCVAIPMH